MSYSKAHHIQKKYKLLGMGSINLPTRLSIKTEMDIELREAWLFNSNIEHIFLMEQMFTINSMITNFSSLLAEAKCMVFIKRSGWMLPKEKWAPLLQLASMLMAREGIFPQFLPMPQWGLIIGSLTSDRNNFGSLMKWRNANKYKPYLMRLTGI